MDYAAASEFLVRAAWTLGISCVVLTLGMIVALFVLRWRLTRNVAVRKARVARWRPRLLDAMTGEIVLASSDIPADEREVFVHVWIGLHEALRGESRQELNRVFVGVGLDAVCRHWLAQARPVDRRLVAAVALGHLGAEEDWSRLHPLLDATQTWMAIAAVQGLMRIDPTAAAGLVLDRLPAHPEWPRDTIRATFQEAGPAAVTAPLLDWMETATADSLPQGLPLIDTGESVAVQAALLGLLGTDEPVGQLVAAIRQADSPGALPALRRLTGHPAWEVRTQAAAALGRLGEPADAELLQTLLADRWWWVRYRAAEARLSLPGTEREDLPALLAGLDDRYARDALRQAAAERWLPQEESPA